MSRGLASVEDAGLDFSLAPKGALGISGGPSGHRPPLSIVVCPAPREALGPGAWGAQEIDCRDSTLAVCKARRGGVEQEAQRKRDVSN